MYGDKQIGGRWNTNEAMDHINILELVGVVYPSEYLGVCSTHCREGECQGRF